MLIKAAGRTTALIAGLSLALTSGCASPVSSGATQTPVIVAESMSGAGRGDWTTRPAAGAPVPAAQWQAAPVATMPAQGYASAGRGPVPTSPVLTYPVLTNPVVENGNAGMPPPPPPPRMDGVMAPNWSTPASAPPNYYTTAPSGAPYAPAPAAAPTYSVVPARTYSGCGLPCEQGISQWHVRAVGGLVFYEGKDPAEDCSYWGIDVGRTFCGCWGLDAYWRTNSGVFDRDAPPMRKDGGTWQHIGGKVTMERAFGTGSRFYGWGGVGGGYFTTSDYVSDDSGPEVYGEVGVGYVLSRNFRIRGGLNVHGMDTDVTRKNPADDGDSRWLWQIAPVLQLEGDF